MTTGFIHNPGVACQRVAEVIKAKILHSGANHPCIPYWTGGGGDVATSQASSLSRAVPYDISTIGWLIATFGVALGVAYGLYRLSTWRHRVRSCQRRRDRRGRSRDGKEAAGA